MGDVVRSLTRDEPMAIAIAKTQFGKLAKTYSSNVVSVVKPVEAASLQS
ncbi:hypothetical protein [Nostoc sp.]